MRRQTATKLVCRCVTILQRHTLPILRVDPSILLHGNHFSGWSNLSGRFPGRNSSTPRNTFKNRKFNHITLDVTPQSWWFKQSEDSPVSQQEKVSRLLYVSAWNFQDIFLPQKGDPFIERKQPLFYAAFFKRRGTVVAARKTPFFARDLFLIRATRKQVAIKKAMRRLSVYACKISPGKRGMGLGGNFQFLYFARWK